MNRPDSPTETNQIASEENVARILSKEWFAKDRLLSVAFALNTGETYLSVNRLAIDSYDNDVLSFVQNHNSFAFGQNNYKRAVLNVGDIRDTNVSVGETKMKIDVEVEPRDTHTKSHAGYLQDSKVLILKRGNCSMLAL